MIVLCFTPYRQYSSNHTILSFSVTWINILNILIHGKNCVLNHFSRIWKRYIQLIIKLAQIKDCIKYVTNWSMSFVSYLSNNKIWSNIQNPSYFAKLAFLSKSKTSLTEELSMISVKCSTIRHFCEVFVIALSSICRLFTFNWPIWVYYANISLIYNFNGFFSFF